MKFFLENKNTSEDKSQLDNLYYYGLYEIKFQFLRKTLIFYFNYKNIK